MGGAVPRTVSGFGIAANVPGLQPNWRKESNMRHNMVPDRMGPRLADQAENRTRIAQILDVPLELVTTRFVLDLLDRAERIQDLGYVP